MKRKALLGIGCMGGVLADRFVERAWMPTDNQETRLGFTNVASLAAAVGVADRVSEMIDADPDNALLALGIGFATGAVLSAFAAPISRAIGSSSKPR